MPNTPGFALLGIMSACSNGQQWLLAFELLDLARTSGVPTDLVTNNCAWIASICVETMGFLNFSNHHALYCEISAILCVRNQEMSGVLDFLLNPWFASGWNSQQSTSVGTWQTFENCEGRNVKTQRLVGEHVKWNCWIIHFGWFWRGEMDGYCKGVVVISEGLVNIRLFHIRMDWTHFIPYCVGVDNIYIYLYIQYMIYIYIFIHMFDICKYTYNRWV